MLEKPLWSAPERNKEPILNVLRHCIANDNHQRNIQHALEVGSGTGQHIVHFAKNLPHITWQSSDQAEYLEGIRLWVQDEPLPNLLPPIEFDVNQPLPKFSNAHNPEGTFDLLYSANTLHIMSWETVQQFFTVIPQLLKPNALVVLYGPFNYNGQFTSDSNAAFHASLQERDANMGIRDSEAVIKLVNTVRLTLLEDVAMPANNRCLIFQYKQA